MNIRNYLYLFFLLFSCDALAMKRATDDVASPKKRHKGILSLFDKSVADKAKSVIDCWKFKEAIKSRGIALDTIVSIGGPKGSGKSFLARHICDELALAPVYENGATLLANCSDSQGKLMMSHLYHSLDMLFKRSIPLGGKSIIWVDNVHFFMGSSVKNREVIFNILKDQLNSLGKENHDILLLLEFNNETPTNKDFFERNCNQSFMIRRPSPHLRKLILNHHMARITALYAQPELQTNLMKELKAFSLRI